MLACFITLLAFLSNEYVKRIHGEDTGFTMLTLSAVETAIKLGAKVVWLPTQSAKNPAEWAITKIQKSIS